MTLTMDDVRASTGTNGMSAISTFAGSGGSSTGHRLAGFKVLLASEFVDKAAETYRANAAPYTKIDTSDIRDVSASDLLSATGLGIGELDLFDGSPPCSAFSTAGKRDAGWGQEKIYSTGKVQIVDDLFFEYARLVKEMQPRAFIAENVTGLVKGTAKGYFKLILQALTDAGYRVKAYIVEAQHSGVPQERQRLIFIGARNDLGVDPTPPRKLSSSPAINTVVPYSLGAGNGTLGVHKRRSGFDRGLRHASKPLGTVGAGKSFPVSKSPSSVMITDRMRDPHADGVDPETGSTLSIGQGAYASTIRARAAMTFGANALARYATLAELRALSGFPVDYALTGDYNNRHERIGRAVPPVMMAHISAHVRDTILKKGK